VRLQRPVLLVVGGVAVALLIGTVLNLSRLSAASGLPEYRLSPEGDAEILHLAWHGGMRRYAVQYRLFGDGRLVREVVAQAQRDESLRADEVRLEEEDIRLLFEAMVRRGLPTATTERLLEATDGIRLSQPKDGATVILRLDFAAYETAGGAEASFRPQVVVPSPHTQARRFPEVRELDALVAVLDALDAYFSQTAYEAIDEVDDRRRQ